MRKISVLIVAIIAISLAEFVRTRAADVKKEDKPVPAALNFTMKSLSGEDVSLTQYQGKVILMVNTASKCGYPPQYEGLEAIYNRYKDKGFVILGFPANNFAQQEPGTDKDIAEFCKANYGVSFPMFSKISVLNPDKAPLYKYLTTTAKPAGEVKWNFEKFLIGRDGQIVARYISAIEPQSDAITQAIEKELNK
jgi:glutathione peroxidase